MWGSLQFAYEMPSSTVPNWISCNWTVHRQIKTRIAKSSREICALLRCYAGQSGNSLLTFQDNLSILSSRIKKSKRQNRAGLKLTDNILGPVHHMIVNIRKAFQKLVLFPFSGTHQLLPWWTLRFRYSQWFGATEALNGQYKHQTTNLIPG
jgi:hypothetical protein